MLIDEPLVGVHSRDPILMLLGEAIPPQRLRPGVYEVGHFGSSAFLPAFDHYPENLDAGREEGEPMWLGPYGVCDSLDDILRLYPILEADPERAFVVTMKRVRRNLANKGQGGGWRWHKWGAYIGKQKPTTEYLDDEPDIEQVFCYHIFEKTKIPCINGMRRE